MKCPCSISYQHSLKTKGKASSVDLAQALAAHLEDTKLTTSEHTLELSLHSGIASELLRAEKLDQEPGEAPTELGNSAIMSMEPFFKPC